MSSRGLNVILAVAAGISAMIALLSLPPLLYYGFIRSHLRQYHAARFIVSGSRLAESRRNLYKFVILEGVISGANEKLTIRQKFYVPQAELSVMYNPTAPTLLLQGRTLRVVTSETFSQLNANLATTIVIFFVFGSIFISSVVTVKRNQHKFKVMEINYLRKSASLIVLLGCLIPTGITLGAEASGNGIIREFKQCYSRQDIQKLYGHFCSQAPSKELADTMRAMLAVNWGKGEITNASMLKFSEYSSTTGLPGEFKGRKLTWAAEPTHWIVLETETKGDVVVRMKYEIAIRLEGKQWCIVPPAYAATKTHPIDPLKP